MKLDSVVVINWYKSLNKMLMVWSYWINVKTNIFISNDLPKMILERVWIKFHISLHISTFVRNVFCTFQSFKGLMLITWSNLMVSINRDCTNTNLWIHYDTRPQYNYHKILKSLTKHIRPHFHFQRRYRIIIQNCEQIHSTKSPRKSTQVQTGHCMLYSNPRVQV